MAIDMAVLERCELLHHIRPLCEHAWKIHELRQSKNLWMAAERQQIGRQQFRAGGFQRGCRHAGRKLHPQIHRHGGRAVDKILQTLKPKHIGDFMRIANRRGGAPR
jgi:hypothetical protein